MIIATVNSKGGVGKTTLAVHLADWFYLHGWKVCIVDCDAQRLSSRWLNEARHEVAAYVMDSPSQINESLPTLGSEFEVVVVDAPGGLGEATGAILTHAQGVILPTGSSNLDIMGLGWTTSTIREVQELRNGLPQTVITLMRSEARRRTTKHLMGRARELGFGITKTVVPYREIYAQVAGLEDRPPRLLWQLGRNKLVRQASLEIDAVFQEVFPEACEDNPALISELVQPKTKKRGETLDGSKQVANG